MKLCPKCRGPNVRRSQRALQKVFKCKTCKGVGYIKVNFTAAAFWAANPGSEERVLIMSARQSRGWKVIPADAMP